MPMWTTENPLEVAPPLPPRQARHGAYAVWGAVLFLPALVLAKIAVLATETGSACLVRGGCTPFPSAFFLTLCGLAAAAMVAALAAPRRMRGRALGAQLLLETVAVLLVLAYP
ncbi:hypothetical protein [Streptomyces sp. NPDC048606]|uniref:hypothetical protein n=1 Tax=Streptomyces sp. NPDC048606 TaxID=3154726 RepID=UPI003432C7CD